MHTGNLCYSKYDYEVTNSQQRGEAKIRFRQTRLNAVDERWKMEDR